MNENNEPKVKMKFEIRNYRIELIDGYRCKTSIVFLSANEVKEFRMVAEPFNDEIARIQVVRDGEVEKIFNKMIKTLNKKFKQDFLGV